METVIPAPGPSFAAGTPPGYVDALPDSPFTAPPEQSALAQVGQLRLLAVREALRVLPSIAAGKLKNPQEASRLDALLSLAGTNLAGFVLESQGAAWLKRLARGPDGNGRVGYQGLREPSASVVGVAPREDGGDGSSSYRPMSSSPGDCARISSGGTEECTACCDETIERCFDEMNGRIAAQLVGITLDESLFPGGIGTTASLLGKGIHVVGEAFAQGVEAAIEAFGASRAAAAVGAEAAAIAAKYAAIAEGVGTAIGFGVGLLAFGVEAAPFIIAGEEYRRGRVECTKLAEGWGVSCYQECAPGL